MIIERWSLAVMRKSDGCVQTVVSSWRWHLAALVLFVQPKVELPTLDRSAGVCR